MVMLITMPNYYISQLYIFVLPIGGQVMQDSTV